MILDRDSKELHHLNPSAALVFALIQEHGFEEAMSQLEGTYTDVPSLQDDVTVLVDSLRDKKLLVDD